MKKYHKINTIWKRDSSTPRDVIIPGDWAIPEFEYLADNEWEFTEKLDGTNIRLIWFGGVNIMGKTDDATIPDALMDVLDKQKLSKLFDKAFNSRAYRDPASPFRHLENLPRVCLYGEGVGARVHRGAGKYGDPKVVLFDVAVCDAQNHDHWWWLDRENVKDVAKNMGFEHSPLIGRGTLHDMVEMVKSGLSSSWGDFQAEGIVARPSVQMWNRRGERIIAKLKTSDYHDLKLHLNHEHLI